MSYDEALDQLTELAAETEAEREEREAVQAGALEYENVDALDEEPEEGPCCADRLCPCGGYQGGNHGPAPSWAG